MYLFVRKDDKKMGHCEFLEEVVMTYLDRYHKEPAEILVNINQGFAEDCLGIPVVPVRTVCPDHYMVGENEPRDYAYLRESPQIT